MAERNAPVEVGEQETPAKTVRLGVGRRFIPAKDARTIAHGIQKGCARKAADLEGEAGRARACSPPGTCPCRDDALPRADIRGRVDDDLAEVEGASERGQFPDP